MSLILDCSVTMACVYADEAAPAALDVFERVIAGGAWVPSTWALEVANVLEMGVRRRRTDAAFRDEALRNLALLPIRADAETSNYAWGRTMRIAEAHRLSLYDAAYLELALRRSLALATLDTDLRSAARAENVPLLGI